MGQFSLSRLAKRAPSNDTVVIIVACVVIGVAIIVVFAGVLLYFKFRRPRQPADLLEGQLTPKEILPSELISLPVLPSAQPRPDSPRPASAPSEESSTAHTLPKIDSQQWASASFLLRPVTPPSPPRQRALTPPQPSPPPVPPMPQFATHLTSSPRIPSSPQMTPTSSTLSISTPLPSPRLRTPSFPRANSPIPNRDPFRSTNDPRSPAPSRQRSVGAGLPASPRATRRAVSTSASVSPRPPTPRLSAESYARMEASNGAWWNGNGNAKQTKPETRKARTVVVTRPPRARIVDGA